MKRQISLSRNLTEPAQPIAPGPIARTEVPSIEVNTSQSLLTKSKAPIVATGPRRTQKVSFLADPVVHERFKKLRLKAGFETLEDAYNEAIKLFCDAVESGKIDRF
jgi:hypothetical protein